VASYAIEVGAAVAVEMLEQGRTFLRSEMRGLGSESYKLRAFYEALADTFASTSCAWSFPPDRIIVADQALLDARPNMQRLLRRE
jgi:hypothetical protein